MTHSVETTSDVLSFALPEAFHATMAGAASPVDLDITVVIGLVLFLGTWFALKVLIFDPYLKVRDEREKGIGGSIEDSEAMKKSADEMLARYELELQNARREAVSVRDTLKSEGSGKERELLQNARQKANESLESRRVGIREDVEKARKELREEAERLSGVIADQLLPQA